MLFGCAAVVCLLACGDGNKGPAAPAAPPAPTPTPLPNFSGTYTSSSIILNVQGQAEVRGTGTTSVTHTPGQNSILLGSLVVNVLGTTGSFGLGRANLSGDTFQGLDSYQSTGCGTQQVTMSGRFAGRLMNLTATFDPSSRSCTRSEVRGEYARQ
jgi:hypothetical protein